jgi:hypothetical protein
LGLLSHHPRCLLASGWSFRHSAFSPSSCLLRHLRFLLAASGFFFAFIASFMLSSRCPRHPRFLSFVCAVPPLSALFLLSRCLVCAIFALFPLSWPCCRYRRFNLTPDSPRLNRLPRNPLLVMDRLFCLLVSSIPCRLLRPLAFPEWIPHHPWRNVAFISRLAPVVTFLPRSSSSRSPPLLRPCRINRCLCAVIPWSFHPFPHLFRLLASSSL